MNIIDRMTKSPRIISCVCSMAKRLAIDAPVSDSSKRHKVSANNESGGCMAYVLWKLGIFGRCELDDVKKALNSEIQPVFRLLNNNRKKNKRVHLLSSLSYCIQ
jgi:predicted nuclease with RNAse H fold